MATIFLPGRSTDDLSTVAADTLSASPPPWRQRTRPARRTADARRRPSDRLRGAGVAHPGAHANRSRPIRRSSAANSARGTPARNLAGIGRAGLLASKSRGRPPVVWLHAAGKTPWALLHTIRRHGGRVENVVILAVDVPRTWLRRSKPGLWYTPRDVPPERIRGLTTFAALTRSPAIENAGC